MTLQAHISKGKI